MWIEKRGQQHRVYWRTRNQTSPKKAFEPFGTREQATAFIELARASSLSGAVAYVRQPSNEALMALLGREPVPAAPEPSTATDAVRGAVASPSGMGTVYDPRPALGQICDKVLVDWRFYLQGEDLVWSCQALLPLSSGGQARLPLTGIIDNVRTRTGGRWRPPPPWCATCSRRDATRPTSRPSSGSAARACSHGG